MRTVINFVVQLISGPLNTAEFQFPVFFSRNDGIIYFSYVKYLHQRANELLYIRELNSTLFGIKNALLAFKVFFIQYAEYVFLNMTKLC